jgi:hypothetical protein
MPAFSIPDRYPESIEKKEAVRKPSRSTKVWQNSTACSFEKGDACCVALSHPGAAFRKSPESSSSIAYISPTKLHIAKAV